MSRRIFGHLASGEPVFSYALQNDILLVEVITLGACLVDVQAPDANGTLAHVVLGSHDLQEYTRKDKAYLGAICGRYAGRIAGARFELDGHPYDLSANDGGRATLHGGADGFDARNWTAQTLQNGVRMSLTSPHGDQGFPGELQTSVTYSLEGKTLRTDFEARTNAPTFVNLTSHAYFNLDGEESGSAREHNLQLRSDFILAQDEHFFPTGEMLPVSGSAFDFTALKELNTALMELSHLPSGSRGFNHTYMLQKDEPVHPAARLIGTSGRVLEILTSEPALQLYTAGYFEGTQRGFSGSAYGREAGVALETQHCPDSPHHPQFPSTLLRPHETFRSETIWKFSVGDPTE